MVREQGTHLGHKIQYFEKSKVMQKLHDTQSINIIDKGRKPLERFAREGMSSVRAGEVQTDFCCLHLLPVLPGASPAWGLSPVSRGEQRLLPEVVVRGRETLYIPPSGRGLARGRCVWPTMMSVRIII